jgi:hypothetical protein
MAARGAIVHHVAEMEELDPVKLGVIRNRFVVDRIVDWQGLPLKSGEYADDDPKALMRCVLQTSVITDTIVEWLPPHDVLKFSLVSKLLYSVAMRKARRTIKIVKTDPYNTLGKSFFGDGQFWGACANLKRIQFERNPKKLGGPEEMLVRKTILWSEAQEKADIEAQKARGVVKVKASADKASTLRRRTGGRNWNWNVLPLETFQNMILHCPKFHSLVIVGNSVPNSGIMRLLMPHVNQLALVNAELGYFSVQGVNYSNVTHLVIFNNLSLGDVLEKMRYTLVEIDIVDPDSSNPGFIVASFPKLRRLTSWRKNMAEEKILDADFVKDLELRSERMASNYDNRKPHLEEDGGVEWTQIEELVVARFTGIRDGIRLMELLEDTPVVSLTGIKDSHVKEAFSKRHTIVEAQRWTRVY